MWQAVARQRGQQHRGAIASRYCRLGPLPAEEKCMCVSLWTVRLSAGGMLSPQAQQRARTYPHAPSPSEAVHYHSARKQPAPPAWILPLIPLHRPDWILAAKASRWACAGCRWVNRQWGTVCKPFSPLPLWKSLWGSSSEGILTFKAYCRIFGMLLLVLVLSGDRKYRLIFILFYSFVVFNDINKTQT